ncbi:MAG TPA: MT-A70 family methyltransferase, partial [Terriglobales bacterium]|nr:MT-A70 family methyltransferase [Terriglobales bacterium]
MRPSKPKRAPKATARAARRVGVSRVYVEKAKSLEAKRPDLYQKVKAGEIDLKKAETETRREKKAAVAEQIRKEPVPPPKGPFRVMVIDPPWKYDNRAEDTTHRARSPYPEMTVEEIKAMDVGGLAAPDCILW